MFQRLSKNSKKGKITGVFFMALFISFTIPRCGFYWQRFPVSLANLLLGIAFLAWIIRAFSLRKGINIGGALGKAALVFLIYSFIWMVVGVFKGEVFGAVVNFAVIGGGMLFFIMTIDLFREQGEVRLFCNLVCLSLFIICSYGLLQVFMDIKGISMPGLTELYGSPEEAEITQVFNKPQVTAGQAWQKNNMWDQKCTPPVFLGTKIFSTFHHGNIFGSHLATFLPLAIAMVIVGKNRTHGFLLAFLSILGGINLFFTNSRGALLGLLVGLGIMAALKKKSLLILISLGLITILLFLLILSWAVFNEHNLTGVAPSICLSHYEVRYADLVRRLFLSPHNTEQWEVIDLISNHRFSTMRVAWEVISHPPTIRSGLFGRSFKLESDQILHNFFITVTYKMGLVGFGLFMGLLIILFGSVFKFLPQARREPRQVMVIGAFAGLAAGLVHNLVDSPFYYPPLAVNFWILAGVIISTVRQNVK